MEENKPQVTYEEFTKLDIRIGTVDINIPVIVIQQINIIISGVSNKNLIPGIVKVSDTFCILQVILSSFKTI